MASVISVTGFPVSSRPSAAWLTQAGNCRQEPLRARHVESARGIEEIDLRIDVKVDCLHFCSLLTRPMRAVKAALCSSGRGATVRRDSAAYSRMDSRDCGVSTS